MNAEATVAVDTNVLVRYIVRDDQKQERAARALFLRSAIFVPPTVLLETQWVLKSVYRFSRERIADALLRIVRNEGITVPHAVRIEAAIKGYRDGLDFADAIHLADCGGAETFATFDTALRKAAPATFETPRVTAP